ncbi:MAG: cob(I)yrinic acid a,c-diamide adenosyltransferase [Patescibacteria group bacterium]
MFLVFTGNGKGKTTAALGQGLRSIGEGRRVLMVQFIKGPWKSGEDTSYKKLAPYLKIVKKGKGFVGILGDKLPRSVHIKAAQDALKYAKKEVSTGKWQMLIMDEISNAIKLKLITLKDTLNLLNFARSRVEHIIFTGRDAPKKFIQLADLVTEMKEIKHPYMKGVKAKKGLEY